MSDQIVFQISTPAPSSVEAISTRGSKIDLLATNIAAIDGVYDDINGADNVGTVAADLLGSNYTGQVAGNIANVNIVAGMSNEITALYAIRADIEDVADIDAETIVVAGIAANVTTVATNISDINSVVTNLSTYQTANTNFSTYQTAVTNLSTYQTANTNFSVLNTVNNNTAAILAAGQTASASWLAHPSTAVAAIENIKGQPLIFGGDRAKFYYFEFIFFDSLVGGRINISVMEAADAAGTDARRVAQFNVVSNYTPAIAGLQMLTLPQFGGSGITVVVPIDLSAYFTSNLTSGHTYANAGLSPKCHVDIAEWQSAIDARVESGILAAPQTVSASWLAHPSTAAAATENIKGQPLIFGGDRAKFYYFDFMFYDSLVGGRINISVMEAADAAGTDARRVAQFNVVSNYTPAIAGLQMLTLPQVSGSGITVVVPIDLSAYFTSNLTSGATYANAGLSPKCHVDIAEWRSAIDARVESAIDGGAAESVIAGALSDEAEIGSAFALCADAYARALFRDGVIAGLDPEDQPWLNYETIYFGGALDLYRVRVFLHSSKIGGGAVAQWSVQQNTTPPALPETIFLTMKSNGSTLTGADTNGAAVQEKGVTAVFRPDWSKIEWTKNATTYSSAASCAVGQRAIITADELERRWLALTVTPRRRITIGSGWEYPTLVAAVQAYENITGVATKSRWTYPISNLIAPEWPALFEIMDEDHEEAIGNFQASDGWQSELRAPHGGIFVLRSSTRLYKAAAVSGNTAPVIESSRTAAWHLNGALIENEDDAGYVFHIDSVNGTSGRNGGGPMRRRTQSIIRGGHLKTASASGSFLLGCGISDGQTMLFENLVFERAGTGLVDVAMAVIHGSPNSTDPGTAIFRNCRTVGEGATKGLVQVIKSSAGAHRHALIVQNCLTQNGVSYANTSGEAGSGWIAHGDMSGSTVPVDLT